MQITAPLPPNPAPTVTSIYPNTGSPDVETPVEITGSGFIDTPSVQLSDTWLLSATLVSSTTLEAVVPAGLPAGVHTLTLYNGDCQQAILEGAFTVQTQFIYIPMILRTDSP